MRRLVFEEIRTQTVDLSDEFLAECATDGEDPVERATDELVDRRGWDVVYSDVREVS